MTNGDEFRNPFHTTEMNLEIAIGAVDFRDKTIENLRKQIDNLRNLVSRYLPEDPYLINDVQFMHLREPK